MKNCFLILSILLSPFLSAQTTTNLAALEEMGLENLAELETLDHYYLSYENNRYRYEGDALIAVLKNLGN